MAKLAAYVHVRDEKGEPHVFGPANEIPEWAENAIDNPKAWDIPPTPTDPAGDDPDPHPAPAKSERGK